MVFMWIPQCQNEEWFHQFRFVLPASRLLFSWSVSVHQRLTCGCVLIYTVDGSPSDQLLRGRCTRDIINSDSPCSCRFIILSDASILDDWILLFIYYYVLWQIAGRDIHEIIFLAVLWRSFRKLSHNWFCHENQEDAKIVILKSR